MHTVHGLKLYLKNTILEESVYRICNNEFVINKIFPLAIMAQQLHI